MSASSPQPRPARAQVRERLRLPRDVERELRRILAKLPSAPAEIRALGQLAPESDDGAAPAAETLALIADWLYTTWYTALAHEEDPSDLIAGRDNLVAALRASSAGSTRWERGWVVVRSAPDGTCLAGRGGHLHELRAGEYVNLVRQGLPVAPGDHIAVSELIAWLDEPTGFWCTRSWLGEPDKPLMRLYVSLRVDQVGYGLMEATRSLDELKLRYSLKCSAFAAGYRRVDSLIIYLEAASWSGAAVALRAMARRLADLTRDATPPLTKRLAKGVALAEDDGTEASFGQSRCQALAPGVLALLQRAPASLTGGVATLARALMAAGIDPAQPWQAIAP